MSQILFPQDTTGVTPATGDIILIADVSDSNNPKDCTLADLPISTATQTALNAKQDTLVSGTNIKTINSTSILGSGDIVIAGAGDMLKSENLSGLANYTTARSNLGLGSAAVSATTDFAPALGVDDNYVTDANLITIGNQSGINTGDNAANTNSGLVHTTGNETIAGVKTFSDPLVLSNDTDSVLFFNDTIANRWAFFKNSSNELVINRYNSSGDYQDSPLVISGTDGSILLNNKLVGNPDFYQYSIVTSVASGNLTVALKNYEGNDPTSTKPVKIMIGGVVRTITSALSDTFPAGTNWRNAGSSELATKEVDYFCYIGIDNLNNIRFGCSRIPNGINQNDFSASGSYTNERYLMDYSISFNVQNIGRFNATLSAGGAYTWSIPATSVIVNSPIYENQKQKNQLIVGEGINQSASYTTSVTMDFSSFTEYDITAQAGALLFNNPSGTPVNGQKRMVRIKDNGTARALTYGSQFASGSATLLTTTVISKKSWMGFEWDSTDSKWYLLATGTQP